MDRQPSYGLFQLSTLNTEAGSPDEQASPSLEPLDEWLLFKLRKYVMILAVLAICVTYQAGLNPPGGIWADTASKHSRIQGIKKLKDVPWKGSRALFSCTTAAIALVSRFGEQAGSLILCLWMAAIAFVCPVGAQAGSLALLLCTVLIWWLVFLWCQIEDTEALPNMSKAQADRNIASASEGSEFHYMGSYTENEPDNSSCSDSMAAIIAVDETPAIWLVGSAFTHHATGNRNLVCNFETVNDLNIQTGDGVHMPVLGRGCVITDTLVLPDVLFVPGLKKNIVSVSQLAQLGCSIVFKHDACYISTATDGITIGKALVGENGMFKLEFLKVPLVN